MNSTYYYQNIGWRGEQTMALVAKTQKVSRPACIAVVIAVLVQVFEELTEQLDTTYEMALRHHALSPEFQLTPSTLCPSAGAPRNTTLTPVSLPFDRSSAFEDSNMVRQLQDRLAELQELLRRIASESEHENRAEGVSDTAVVLRASEISVELRQSAESELAAIKQQIAS